jgi:CO/xanthine dehydrogenase Mo-binding subunit
MDYRPWTWKLPENYKETQPKIARQDAVEKASGNAVYTRDVFLPGLLYAKILSSPYAHAKIKSIDSSAAEALPGVRDILKYSDSEVELDTGTGLWYEASGMVNVLSFPEQGIFPHPMGAVVVADGARKFRPGAASDEDRGGTAVHPGWRSLQRRRP